MGSPLWLVLLPSLSLRPTVDTTVDTVDTTVDTVDTDIEDTTEARGPLMLNLRPKPLPDPKLMLKLHHGVDTTVDTTDTDTPVLTDTTDTTVPTDTDTDTVISARGLLMLNPKPRLKLHHGADTIVDTVDTTVVDTTVVDTTGVEIETSG